MKKKQTKPKIIEAEVRYIYSTTTPTKGQVSAMLDDKRYLCFEFDANEIDFAPKEFIGLNENEAEELARGKLLMSVKEYFRAMENNPKTISIALLLDMGYRLGIRHATTYKDLNLLKHYVKPSFNDQENKEG